MTQNQDGVWNSIPVGRAQRLRGEAQLKFAVAVLVFLAASSLELASAQTPQTSTAPLTTLSVAAPSSVGANDVFNVTVTALGADGHPNANFADTIHFSSLTTAQFPNDYTFVPGDGGNHIFGVALSTPGTQTVTVQDLQDPTDTTVAPATFEITVRPPDVILPHAGDVISFRQTPLVGPSTVLTLATPARILQGEPFTVIVTANDASGLPRPDFQDTISFSSSGNAILPRDYIFTLDDAGTHQFTAVILTLGTSVLGVRDLSNAGVGSRSATVRADATPVAAVAYPPPNASAVVHSDPVLSPPGAKTGTLTVAVATCPPGMLLISGGGEADVSDQPDNAHRVVLGNSFPSSTVASASWTAEGVVAATLEATERMIVTAYAVCQ